MVSDMQIASNYKREKAKANHLLRRVTRLLFAIAVIGQWAFVYYIVAFYWSSAVRGDYAAISERLPHGIIKGDSVGNFMLGVHLFLAAIIIFGGPLQFFDRLRHRFPAFHRWNGRVYLLTAFLISIAGLYLIYTRGVIGGIPMGIGNTLNASLIMTFSVLTLTTALKKDFVAHKKWALRAFLMVCGVWFFRIGYGLWILLTGFTVPGSNDDLTGPFDIFLGFGHSLVPLILLEIYFFAKSHTSIRIKKIASGLFALLCLLLTGGIIMAAMVFWLPNL